jgi:hypothetical protein
MEVILSPETTVHIRTTRRSIPEDGNILLKENFSSAAFHGLRQLVSFNPELMMQK